MSEIERPGSDDDGLPVKMRLPSIEEQRRIATNLRDFDAELAALKRIEAHLNGYRNDILGAILEGDGTEQ